MGAQVQREQYKAPVGAQKVQRPAKASPAADGQKGEHFPEMSTELTIAPSIVSSTSPARMVCNRRIGV